MQTIIIIARENDWLVAKRLGIYTKSTINSDLNEVGFIHCTTPSQTLATANKHFTSENDLILLFIYADKVTAEVKFEPALSGRPGLFPHIYGPLNIDSVYKTEKLKKDSQGLFVEPSSIKELTSSEIVK